MRVLLLSNIEWSDNNAFGNTMSNLFSSVDGIEVASLYRRSSMPNNNICKKYFKISYISIIKNFFKKEKIGEHFEYQQPQEIKTVENTEKKAISLIHKVKLNKIIYFIEDMLFETKKWENKKFKNFLQNFSPDIIFCFAKASKTHLLFIKTILKYLPNCKFVTFVVDDIYEANKSKRYKKIIAEQLKLASKVYAITPSLKDKYQKIFGVNIDILTKGCDFSLPVTRKENRTKTIVYAGNLLYGRDKTLIKLAEEIKAHNDNGQNKLFLKIFSPTIVDKSVADALNVDGVSKFYGAKPFSEIVSILNQSDIVLHVESFDSKQQKVVKHSFSTKITDCLQSGSVLFAVGPECVASMAAAKEIDGSFTAFSNEEIKDVIAEISAADLYENACKTRKYAEEHFNILKIRKKLISDFNNIIQGG